MITIHDMFPIEYVEYFGQVYSMYFKYNLKKTLKNTDMILYNSEQTKSTTEEFFPEAKSIANVNAYIISNPVKSNGIIKMMIIFFMLAIWRKERALTFL